MKKIGLFFGTFNPIHNGHLMMANYIINNTDIDSILFVVNPTAPFKKNDNLLSFKDRMRIADLATFKYRHIQATDIENNLPLPAYTYNTFRYYVKTYKEKFEFVLILGCDNLDVYKRQEYVKRGRVYKRNMLLYSPPGMGKTSLINLLVEDLVKNRNGFVLSLTDDNDILNFNDAMSYILSLIHI